MPERIIVCGGRKFADRELMAEVLYQVCEGSRSKAILVHGAQTGADQMCADLAQEWGVTDEPHPANLTRYGSPAAYHVRNKEMAEAGAELVIAFPGGPGTASMTARARKAGIPVIRPRRPRA